MSTLVMLMFLPVANDAQPVSNLRSARGSHDELAVFCDSGVIQAPRASKFLFCKRSEMLFNFGGSTKNVNRI